MSSGVRKIMDQDTFHLAYLLLQPSRPMLITTISANGSVNAAPASWITPLSENPPMFGLALLTVPEKQHTLMNIERTGEFVLNVPTLDIVDRLVLCSYSYPEDASKFDMAEFEPVPSMRVSPPGIAQCRANLECKVHRMVPCGDHTLVIADLLVAHYDSTCYAADLSPRLDRRFPCLHVKRYHQENGQAHSFLSPTGVVLSYVPYEPQAR